MAGDANNQERPKLSETVIFIRAIMLGKEQHAPVLRPHTWVFLRQKDNRKEPVIRLGIVFNTWPRKFNMLCFRVKTNVGDPVEARGRFTVLDNGETGLILDHRWCWDSLLHQYKGLSAGNL